MTRGRRRERRSDEPERRRIPRQRVQESTFVVLKRDSLLRIGKPRPVAAGRIVDISLSGIRVQYKTTGIWACRFDHLSIFADGERKGIDIDDIRIVSDFSVERSVNGTCLRRCGVQFGPLEEVLKRDLGRFIGLYGV